MVEYRQAKEQFLRTTPSSIEKEIETLGLARALWNLKAHAQSHTSFSKSITPNLSNAIKSPIAWWTKHSNKSLEELAYSNHNYFRKIGSIAYSFWSWLWTQIQPLGIARGHKARILFLASLYQKLASLGKLLLTALLGTGEGHDAGSSLKGTAYFLCLPIIL